MSGIYIHGAYLKDFTEDVSPSSPQADGSSHPNQEAIQSTDNRRGAKGIDEIPLKR